MHRSAYALACLLGLFALTVASAQPATEAAKPAAAKPADKPLAVGDKIEVFWGSRWWPASIVRRDGERSFIKYDGWPDAHNQWVTPERIRRPGEQKPNPAPNRPGQPPAPRPAPADPKIDPADIIPLDKVPEIDPNLPPPAWNLQPDPFPAPRRPLTDRPILLKHAQYAVPANRAAPRQIPARTRVSNFGRLLIASPAAARAFVCYESDDIRRVERIDLAAGASVDQIKLTDKHDALALSADATRLVARSNGFLHGTRDHLEIWALDKNPPAILHSFYPYGGHEKFERDAEHALFIDATRLFTVNPRGVAVLWDLSRPKPAPIHRMNLRPNVRPILSPGGKYLVVQTSSQIVILDPLTGQSVARLAGASHLGSEFAFSPDGRQLAISTSGDIRVYDFATSNLLHELSLPSGVAHSPIAFMSEGTLLAGFDFLIDLKLRMPVWRYLGARSTQASFNGRHWFVTSTTQLRGVKLRELGFVLVSAALPDADARQAIAAVKPDELNIIKPGSSVSIEMNVDAPDEVRDAAIAALTAQLKKGGLNVRDDEPLKLVATSAPGEAKTQTYSFGLRREDADVTPTQVKVTWVADGRPVWERGIVIHAPPIVSLRKDQALADNLSEARNRSISNFFNTITIPTTVPNIPEDRALGASQLTPDGPKPTPLPHINP